MTMDINMDNTPSVQSPSPVTNQALGSQQVQLLFVDIESLRSLRLGLASLESQNAIQLGMLFRRVNKCLERMDELAHSVVLDKEQMHKFQEDKLYLDKLAFELAGSFNGGHHGHHFFGHGHEHKKWKKHYKWMKHGDKLGFGQYH